MSGSSEAGALVRSYSLELEQRMPPGTTSHNLSVVLIENEHRIEQKNKENAKWRKYYEEWEPIEDVKADPNTKSLREQAVLLSHSWKVFRGSVPSEDKTDLENRPPSVEGLVRMVDSIARNWKERRDKTKTGKFMNHFTGFCSTLDAHSNMLEVLPNGNQYVSLFTGSLKSIIKASANYEKIASGLGKALSEMSEEIVACEKELEIYKTGDMQKKVANFYAHVFLFLQDTMEWYLKKQRTKVLDAFREDFFTHFEDEINNIKRFSTEIQREAHRCAMGETRSIRLTAERIEDIINTGQADLRLALDGLSRENADIKHDQRVLLREIERDRDERLRLQTELPQRVIEMEHELLTRLIGTNMFRQLKGVAQDFIDNRTLVHQHAQNPVAQIKNEVVPLEVTTYKREDILFYSRDLVGCFQRNRVQVSHESIRPVSLEHLAVSSLTDWTTATAGRILSIAGQKGTGVEQAQMSQIASMCVNFARKSKLPVISYFCELSRGEKLRPGNTRESQALVALLYSFLRQMIEELPMEFESESNFGQERFSRLDGTLKTWKEAVDLFNDLLQLMPKILLCVIDGYQWLDDRSTEKYLKELVRVLRGGAASSSNVFKVLLTTTGRSRSMLGELSQSELCLADRDGAHGSAARRGGHVGFAM